MEEKEQQEFSLEDILKEFGDENEQILEKTPEEILNEVEREVLGEPILVQEEEPEQPQQATVGAETIRFEKITEVRGTVRNAQPIADEEDEELPLQPEQPGTEPYSEEWEPEYEQPIAEYIPPNPIPFQPRSRLREIKKKLVDGPEKMYYALSEKGVGKLQLAIGMCALVVLLSASAMGAQALGLLPDRMRFVVFGQFLAMLVAAFLGSFQLLEGLSDLAHKRFTLNTMLVFTFALCCVDGLLCLYQLRLPCCAAFSLQMTMALWSTYQKRSTKLGRLDTMRKATRLDSITAVADYYEDVKGLVRGEGRVEDFEETLDEPCADEKLLSRYALIAACTSVAIGIVSGVIGGINGGILNGIGVAIQVAAVTTLAAIPASMFITLSRPMAVLERKHHAMGVVLCGWQGVEGLSGKAVFPVDHNDLFPVGTVKMNGVKFYTQRPPDETVAYAAALIEADGGSLEPLFTHLLDSRNGMHYAVESFQAYGDGGIGGQINGEPVLVGTIPFLKNMGVEIPEGLRVNQAVCVAVDGELCGLFAIAYEKDRASSAGMTTLCGYQGLKALITTEDFMVTEEFIRERFGVKLARVVFPERELRPRLREKSPELDTQAQALITGEGLSPFAYAVTGARALKNACKVGAIVHMAGGIVGMAIMLILGILGATELLTPANMFLYELVWLVPGLLITEWTRSI